MESFEMKKTETEEGRVSEGVLAFWGEWWA